jgi:hypothetical protein
VKPPLHSRNKKGARGEPNAPEFALRATGAASSAPTKDKRRFLVVPRKRHLGLTRNDKRMVQAWERKRRSEEIPSALILRRRNVSYTLKEEPQPQVLFTLGLLNLKPEPSMDSM